MTVHDRNSLIDNCIVEMKVVHDKYFPRGKPLSDSDWRKCIDEMNEVAEKYKEEIPMISGRLCMTFLDDIEEYHRKWIEYEIAKK